MKPGQQLGPYRILQPIGAGGMGEVWEAEDDRLGRRVALKVLPEAVAGDSERLARFEREARAVAALNHPNIVTLYGIERVDGAPVLAMELVEGRPLSELIPSQGMRVDRLLPLATEISDALATAHEHGILHRDLKPANIMVTPDGRVKVLDFGLAKLRGSDEDEEPPTQTLTGAGQVMGTLPYMSPEQLQGRPTDQRSDIFSLGVLLYEMATGRRPFQGDSSSDVISSILRDDPPLATRLNPSLPHHVGRILRLCVEKEARGRYQSARDVHNELRMLQRELDRGELAPEAGAGTQAASSSRRIQVGIALALLLAVGLVAWQLASGAPRAQPAGAPPVLADVVRLTADPGLEVFPSLSPDGRTIAFAGQAEGRFDVYVQRVGGHNAINLTPDSPAHDTHPAFSPDGERIAFRSDRLGGGLFVMGATGEAVRRLTDFGHHPAWSPDGRHLVVSTEAFSWPDSRLSLSELWRIEVETGQGQRLYGGDAIQPSWSPNGHRIAYWGLTEGRRNIWTVGAGGGAAVAVTQDAFVDWNPVWSPDGRYLYFLSDRGGSMNLWRVAIDERSGESHGSPEPVPVPASYTGFVTMAGDGRTVAFAAADRRSNLARVALDPQRLTAGPIEPITRGSHAFDWPHVSPDGRQIVFRGRNGHEDLFVVRTDGTGLRRLTSDPHFDRRPRWSPDGRTIAFYSTRGGRYDVWTVAPDGGGLTQLTHTEGPSPLFPVWSPDGKRIAFSQPEGELGASIVRTDRGWQEQAPEALPPLGDGVFAALDWSSDGQRLAGHRVTPDGQAGVLVYDFATQEYLVIHETARWPRWLPDGRHILAFEWETVLLFDARDGSVREILRAPPATSFQSGDIGPAGDALYLALASEEADLWVARLE